MRRPLSSHLRNLGSIAFAFAIAWSFSARNTAAAAITTAELENGLRVLVLPDSATPTVTASLWIGAGLVHNPRGREGLAELCAGAHEWRVRDSILRRQVGKPYLAGSLTSLVSTDHCVFSITALESDLETALETLRSVVTPGGGAGGEAGDEADNQAGDGPFLIASAWKREALVNLLQTRFAPSLVADDALSTLLFGDRRPLGFSARFQTLLGLLPADVRAFHAQHYRPGNAILTVEGSVDAARARAAAASRFQDWKAAGPSEPPAWGRAAPAPARAGVTLLDDPDATRAIVVAGLSGPGREDTKGFAGVQLLHQVLGGKRMEEVVAGVTGGQAGTYQFRAQLRASARGSEVSVEAIVPHDVAPQALAELRRALGQLGRSGIDAAGFDSEVKARANALAFRFETTSSLAREAVARLLTGQPLAAAAEPPKPLALKREAVTAQWSTLLDNDHMVWVILGRAAELAPKLTAAGIEHARGDLFEVVTGRLLAAGLDSLSQSRPIATVQAEEMILAAIEAKGGFEALERIENYTVEDSVFVRPGDQSILGSRRLHVRFPDRYREDLDITIFQGRSLIQVVNGNDVWRDDLGKISKISGYRSKELVNRLWLDGLRVFHRYGEPGAVAFIVDPDVVGEVTLDGFQISSPDGNWVRIYLHPTSRLVGKRATEKPGEDGEMLAVEEIYTDYRPVEGVFIPFGSATLLDGAFSTEIRTESVNINSKLEPGLFVRPE